MAAWAGALFVLAIGAPLCLGRLFSKQSIYSEYNDDFFYYAQIARNLAQHGISSFDGIHLTNGYHPLWLLLLTLLFKLTTGRGFYVGVQLVMLLMGLLTYWLAAQTLRYFTRDAWSIAVCAAALGSATFIFRTGMEVTIAIPALFAVLWYRLNPAFAWTQRQALLYGLLGSLAVLSRIDSLLFLFLLFAGDLFAFGWRKVIAQLPWLVLGMAPLVVYVASNVLIFHTLGPVSAMAKELRLHHYPSLTLFQRVAVAHRDKYILLDCGLLAELLAVTLLLLLPRLLPSSPNGRDPLAGSGSSRATLTVLWAIVVFPLLYCLVEIILSDWPLFFWYLYPVVLVFFVTIVCILCLLEQAPAYHRYALAAGTAILFLVAGAYTAGNLHKPIRPMEDLAVLDPAIVTFMEQHPGTYAVGNRAGLIGYLSTRPVVQLEGLVMDRAFLANIDSQAKLHDVLHRYGVRYYIAGYGDVHATPDNCYQVLEPAVSGDDAKRMRGTFCNPVASFKARSDLMLIFDLGGPAATPAGL